MVETDRRARRGAAALRAGGVLVACLLAGALTFPAQRHLPDAVASFANSASGWTLVTAVLVGVARLRPVLSAVSGAAGFVLLTCGYALAADLAGLYYNPVPFSVIGVVVGPFVGLVAAWLRSGSGVRVALATALLAGIGVGDAVHGLTVVAATTSPVYWLLVGAVALVLLVWVVAVRRLRRGEAVIAVLGTVGVAAALRVGYRVLGG